MRFIDKKSKGCFVRNSLYFFMAFSFLCLISSCKPKEIKSLTNQEWYIDHIAYARNSNVPNISYYVVRFYPNQNFSLFSTTGFAFGQWRFTSDKSFIQLHPNFGGLRLPDLFWKIELQLDNKLQFGLYPSITHNENLKDITLLCTGITNKSSKTPFYFQNTAGEKDQLLLKPMPK